jgi:GMP synthase (glutamine-hydrolysing)
MAILVLQHVAGNTLGELETVLQQKNLEITYVQSRELTDMQADLRGVDGLIILGGFESVTETHKNPHLLREQRMIRQAVTQNLPVFGICLGSQVLSSALGGTVSRNRYEGAEVKEIGWTPLFLNAAGERDPVLQHLEGQAQFQWHEDSFTIPEGAIHLAESELCANQAFRVGEIGSKVYGVQFHPEITRDSIEEWLQKSKTLPEAQKQAIRQETHAQFDDYSAASLAMFSAYCDLAY